MKKGKNKNRTKKSNHKHIYKLREIIGDDWFTHELVCEICGKVGNKIKKDKM